MMKAKPGQKLCSSCNEVNGVRAFECKKCGEAFKMKRRRRGFKKKQVEDHTTLKKGDLIRVVGGSGTYWVGENGDKHYFTDRGKYIVTRTEKDGIVAVGPCGSTFLYMGKLSRSPILSTMWRSPHKIVLLQSAATEVDRLT
jgi:NAD(P)H-flavin reductase